MVSTYKDGYVAREGSFGTEGFYCKTITEPTSSPTASTTMEDYEFVQGGLCGENWTDMMRGAIELSRNNGEPAKDPMECAKLTAENSECGSYFVQRNDYHVCWCMSKQGVHADCNIRDDWQIHSSGNSYGSIYKLVDSCEPGYKKILGHPFAGSSCETPGLTCHQNSNLTPQECAALCTGDCIAYTQEFDHGWCHTMVSTYKDGYVAREGSFGTEGFYCKTITEPTSSPTA